MRVCLGIIGAFLISSTAVAEPITFDLNCVVNNDAGFDHSAIDSFGTITLTDNGDSVDIKAELTSGTKVHSIYMNADQTLLDAGADFETTSNDITEKPDSLPNGNRLGGLKFDLADPDKGSLGTAPYMETISASGFDLDPESFLFTTNQNDEIYMVVHIGGLDGGDSIWVGAKLSAVPEPGSALLMAGGLVALGALRRRRNRRNAR